MHIDFLISMLLILKFYPIFPARISKYCEENNSKEILQKFNIEI